MGGSIDASERGLRELLAELPDGEFEHTSYLDRPATEGGEGVELVKINCKMTKAGDRLVFDYNGSDGAVARLRDGDPGRARSAPSPP